MLRRKLIYLLTTFALFVVAATSFTVYSIQLLIEDTVAGFYDWMDRSSEVANLRVATDEYVRSMTEIVQGRQPLTDAYRRSHDRFMHTLEQTAGSAGSLGRGTAVGPAFQPVNDRLESRSHTMDPRWREIARLAAELRQASSECLDLVDAGRVSAAATLLSERIAGDLADKLDARLREVQPALETGRSRSVERLVATKTTVLVMATALSVFAGVLVLGGGLLIGRWLIAPIADLQRVAEEFRRGNLAHRATPRYQDELGQLGQTLNTMAGSLAQAQGELRTSEAKYRGLFRNLRDAVIICDGKGVIVECHDGDTHLLGTDHVKNPLPYGRGSVGDLYPVGQNLLDAWPEWRSGTTDWMSLIDRVSRWVDHEAPYRADDVELTRPDESKTAPNTAPSRVVDLVVYPLTYDDARYVAILLRDVRERHRLQRRIRQTEKMQMAGTMAGGIAHDFNNLLTSAIGTLSLVETEGLGDKTPGRIKTALRACWQAAGLSRRLLMFAHSGQEKPQVIRLSEMVELILGSQDETFFKGLSITSDLNADVLVRADKDGLTQVVLNLLRNAKDAIVGEGKLHIRVDSTQATPEEEGASVATYARLSVKDTGMGMTREVRARIFDPFFTTKNRTSRRGTGMGMAVAYSVVRGAGGFIHVASEVGTGTTVSVYLPLADGTPEPLKVTAGATLCRTGRTVLLVDDDPMVLHTCTDVLETLGCTVVTAQSVAEGRLKFQDAGTETIALAVIDIALSDGSGLDLAKSLLSVDPQLRLVLMTGLGDVAVPVEIEGQVLAVLTKPFRLEELAATLSAATSPEQGNVQ